MCQMALLGVKGLKQTIAVTAFRDGGFLSITWGLKQGKFFCKEKSEAQMGFKLITLKHKQTLYPLSYKGDS